MPKKVKVPSKNEEPKVQAETEESPEHEEPEHAEQESQHVEENTSSSEQAVTVTATGNSASVKTKEAYGPLLKSILTGEIDYPQVSLEETKKEETKKEECPLLLAALSTPSKLPTTPPRVASPLSSPTKAMKSLHVSSPTKATATVSPQSLEEQEQSSSSRSRARSLVVYESPYNTRSKTKRVRDKEQRSASEETTKRTSKD